MQHRRLPLFLMMMTLMTLLLLVPALAQAASVSGTVFIDRNVNGAFENENGLSGAELVLTSRTGESMTLSTPRNGEFLFEGLVPGEYQLSVTLPGGYVPTIAGGDSALLPAQGETSQTPWFTLNDTHTVLLGATKSDVYFSFFAFVDENANGGRMLSEELVRDVKIDIYAQVGGQEHLTFSGVTDRNGALVVRNLSPATYIVTATLPQGYIIGPKGEKLNGFYNCINPSADVVGRSDPIDLFSGSVGMGIGMVTTGQAQGTIWFDQNMNGKLDTGEAGFENAVVTLSSEELGLTRTTQVAPDGSYRFEKLQPATYTFHVSLPAGSMFTLPGDSQFTDGYATSAASFVVVNALETAQIEPVGVMPQTSLAVSFFLDTNANGVRDAHEQPFSSAKIEVLTDGVVRASVFSDNEGVALLPVVRGGALTLRATLENGLVFSNSGADNAFETVGAQSTSELALSIEHGTLTTLSAAVTEPAQMRGVLFSDENINGILDDGESGISGFTVQAVDLNGNVVAQCITDAQGAYTLTPLVPDAHNVRLMLSDPYIASMPDVQDMPHASAIILQNADYGETNLYALAPGQSLDDITLGIFRAATVTGYVYQNKNHDALTTNEGGMPNITVTLLNTDGTVYADFTNAVTDDSGMFYIKGILPGSYMLQYAVGDNMLFTTTDEATLLSDPFEVRMGDEVTAAPVGAVRTASILGTAMHMGAPIDATIVAQGHTHHTNLTVSTDENGAFSLTNLRPDSYTITVELPEEYVFAYDTCALVPAVAEAVSSADITLGVAQTLTDQSIIAALPAAITGYAYYDENDSGARDEGETLLGEYEVNIVDHMGNLVETVITTENGGFTSSMLIPGDYTIELSLSDALLVGGALQGDVWKMPFTLSDGEFKEMTDVGILLLGSISGNVWSMDGSKDELGGITVMLYTADNQATPLWTAQTDTNGAFHFHALRPTSYVITALLPDGYQFARTVDTENAVSYILADTKEDAQGASATFDLPMGMHVTGADIGIGAKGAIGDYAWLDENGNGMQDIGEKGIPDIQIELYQYGQLVAQTTTDVYGHYYLADLYPGLYTLRATMHSELRTTIHQTEFPLVASVLSETDDLTAEATDIIVPSKGYNSAVDLGFTLRKQGEYPAAMDTTPTTDWSFGGTKNR